MLIPTYLLYLVMIITRLPCYEKKPCFPKGRWDDWFDNYEHSFARMVFYTFTAL